MDSLKRRAPAPAAGLGLLLCAAAGCRMQAEPLPEGPAEVVLGRSVEGREIPCTILGPGPETILVIACIHGNEPGGGPLVEELVQHLMAHPETLQGRRVALVAAANPDGLERGSRYNARGIDLNRNFPSGNHEAGRRSGGDPLSEPESRALADLIGRCVPDRIVSIHAPLGCVDYDGPAEGVARAMSEACGLELGRIGGQPGSLGSYAGEDLGIPLVTLELTRRDNRRDGRGLWGRYGAALLSAIEGRARPALRRIPTPAN